MSVTDGPYSERSEVADVDLSGSQYRCVVKTATGVALPGAAGVRIAGVVQNAPTAGQMALVRYAGPTKIVANGAFAINDELSVAATDGEVDTAIATHFRIGQAMQAAAGAGEIVEMMIAPNGLMA